MPRGNDILTDSDAEPQDRQSNVSNTPGLAGGGRVSAGFGPGRRGRRYPSAFLLSVIIGIAPFLNDPAIVCLRTHFIPVTRATRALIVIKQREGGHLQAECEQRETECGDTGGLGR